MNSEQYLESLGWKKGEALRSGGLKKPLLVKHKRDMKGLGHGSDEHDVWWDKLFEGQLKGLDIKTDGGNVTFNVQAKQTTSVTQKTSPLYRMFVWGGVLEGSVDKFIRDKKSESSSQDGSKLKKKSKSSKYSDLKDGITKSKVKKSKKKKEKRAKSKEEQHIMKLIKGLKVPC